MAQTRGATGNAKPRVFAQIDTTPANPRKTATTKRATPTTKKSVTGAGVKKRAPNTHHKRKPHTSDKIKGAAEKVVGKVERKPGKVAAGTKKSKSFSATY